MNLGISVYPNEDNIEKIRKYLILAAKYGVKRVFTNFLGFDQTKSDLLAKISEICWFAQEKGMEVVVDVDPQYYEAFQIDVRDVTFFKKRGITTIRFDLDLGSSVAALLSNNNEGIKIEINASDPSLYLPNILALQGNYKQITASHNFYPQRWTGLDCGFFLELSQRIKQQQVAVSAFVALQGADSEGPWDVNEKLPTLEMHRDLPLDFQVRHFIAMNVLDSVIISTQYASEAELELLSELVSTNKVMLKVALDANLSVIEREILLLPSHFVRRDVSAFLIRSSMPRITYQDDAIVPRSVDQAFFERGDVTLLNDNYGRYKGELQIILQRIPNDGRRNLVAKLLPIEHNLLTYLTSYRHFKFLVNGEL